MRLKRTIISIGIVVFLLATKIFAQEEKQKLFEEVTSYLNSTKVEYGQLLSADEYNNAVTHLNKAKKMDSEGKSYTGIKTELELAISSLTKVNATVNKRSEIFSKILDTRKEALELNADKYATSYWESAEKKINKVLEDFSDKNIDDVKKEIPAAVDEYSKAKNYATYSNKLVTNWLPLQNANQSLAYLLSPNEYDEGMLLFEKSLAWISDGKEMEKVQKTVDESGILFIKSEDASKKYAKRYSELLKGRKESIEASAESYSKDLFKSAEENVKESAVAFGKDKMSDAVELSLKAQNKYLEAKHLAVKTKYFSKVDELIKQAEKDGANDYAAKTLNDCKQTLEPTYKNIELDRYDEVKLIDVAKEAEAKANLAIEITHIAKNIDEGNLSIEDLTLDWKEQIKKCDKEFQVVAPVKNEIKPVVKSDKVPEAVYSIFNNGEAEIIDAGPDLMIRITALKYGWLEYMLRSNQQSLIDKTIAVLNYFPSSKITIAGYNDYVAAQKFNAEITQKRADAIRDYILRHSNINPTLISAIGYGELNPITEDNSPEGRAKNTRIEINIKRKE